MKAQLASAHSLFWYAILFVIVVTALFVMFSRPAAETPPAPTNEKPAVTVPQ